MDWKILFYIVLVICLLYLYLSVFVFAYSIWKDRNLNKYPIWGVKFLNEYFFFFGAWIGLTFFFFGGFEKALFFLPDSWGAFNEEGDWTSHRTYLSIALGITAIIFLLSQVTNFKKIVRDIKKRYNKLIDKI